MTEHKDPLNDYCTGIKAIANYLSERLGRQISERTVHNWIRYHGLPYMKMGGWTVAHRDDLNIWMAGEKFPL